MSEAAELDTDKRVALKAKYDAWRPKFVTVQSMSVDGLCALMEKSGTPAHGKVVLVDVRPLEEYQVRSRVRHTYPIMPGSSRGCSCSLPEC